MDRHGFHIPDDIPIKYCTPEEMSLEIAKQPESMRYLYWRLQMISRWLILGGTYYHANIIPENTTEGGSK